MKKTLLIFFIVSLLMIPVLKASGQTIPNVFDTSEFPQWGKDLRRMDIIMFGVFPFSMFFVTTVMDSIRWYEHSKFSFSEADRRYAPWPLKSAGAVEMTKDEHFQTIMIAAGVSVTVAIVDLLIVKIRRDKERRRIESMQKSTYNIDKNSLNPVIEEDSAGEVQDEGENEATGNGAE